ncbi:hypothetical protein [Nocardia wallacei]|uniref:hypothetical protein n=1 Tax=Nocardia wallacei TaxID=480035 RepID=UPI002458D18A|nr:hypothetical protein [Nocardia wallacei]
MSLNVFCPRCRYTDQVPGGTMPQVPITEALPETAARAPKAVGFVRTDISGLDAPRHAVEVQRHADALGYRYLCAVRPPVDSGDPIAYMLGLAAALSADVIVTYDLGHIDSRPALVCDEGLDLEIVCPKQAWARSTRPAPAAGSEAA